MMALQFRDQLWKVFEPAVDYLFPAVCAHCQIRRRLDRYLCGECWEQAFPAKERAVHPEEGLLCAHRMNPVVRTLIHGLKYQGLRGVPIYLLENTDPSFWESPVLQKIGKWAWIPVPLHPARMRERGYNQSEIIAQCLQKRIGGNIYLGVLKRISYSPSQTRLDSEVRKWNVAGAFRARSPVPYSAMLIDDVYTTGATTSTCRFILEQTGCQALRTITLAYEPKSTGVNDWLLDLEHWGNRNVK